MLSLALLVLDLAPIHERKLDPQRVIIEDCVWSGVQRQLGNGTPHATIDDLLEIGRIAVAPCDREIEKWAANSPAVRDGENVVDVADRMRTHFIARGALFAEGKAKPFYLERARPPAARSNPPVVPTPPKRSN